MSFIAGMSLTEQFDAENTEMDAENAEQRNHTDAVVKKIYII